MLKNLGSELEYKYITKLMSIKFDSRQIPKDIRERFEFQIGFNLWYRYDDSKGRLEKHLWNQAEYILTNAEGMKDPT